MTGGALQSQERLYHRRLRRRSLDDCTVNPNSTAMYEFEDEGKEDLGDGGGTRRRSNPASGKKRESLKVRGALHCDCCCCCLCPRLLMHPHAHQQRPLPHGEGHP